MKVICEVLQNDADIKLLLQDLKKARLPLALTGLSNVHKGILTSLLLQETKKKIILIAPNEMTADLISNDLKSLGHKALHFPLRDYCIQDLSGYSREYERKRIDTLSKVLDGAFDVLVLSVNAASQYTIPPEILKNSFLKLKIGFDFPEEELSEKLILMGYRRSEICEGEGQFSIRGGIFDIFPIGFENPFRMEFWGDEIDTMAYFDVETQRRTDNIEEITLTPASEVLYNPEALKNELEDYLKSNKKLTENQKNVISSDINALSNGISFSSDRYLSLIYKEKSTVFDYIKDATILVCESANVNDSFKTLEKTWNLDATAYLEEGFLSEKTCDLWLSKTEFWDICENAIILENFPRSSYDLKVKDIINFNFKRSTAWSGDINVLLEDISYIHSQNGTVLILAGEKKAAEVLCDTLNEKGISARLTDNALAFSSGVFVSTGGLSDGFEIPSQKFMLITQKFIAADKRKRRKRPKNAEEIGSLDDLREGDYVVHEAHGIGIFDGIHRITNAGVTKDYIKIKYAKSDVLYVPVTQLDIVSRYIGSATEGGGIKLNTLGSAQWFKTKQRVKKAVKDMAKQLTQLYAKRMQAKGYAFSPDTDLQNDFERRFEYEETFDQLRCIDEIKGDMEREIPMDRLLCGDVGFGKTEVALRAAFKCISEGKQCVLLVPTTILCMQHYNTIIRRFGDMPVNVAMLNRFVSPKKQKQIIDGLKNGRVDMVVGTHRLISKDIAFKDIGLVIIDEEQRFGVAQKESLKEAYPFVDILTLSATPIPRTLNMALSGLRDMSSIDEAPGDRHPVQTYVLEQNNLVLIDAINKELRRGGQVYYLHNRVETIDICAAKLKRKLPEANIGVAHGQMSEDELSEVWQKLLEHEIDILVCTTIIETGVDVPNANTLIIEDAHKMGLSQLHQLRGRVGRSPRRAYAYFCFPVARQLTDIAAKRLAAIREYTEFGSGFKIAMRDLEIRGAGSILGGEQHGNMESVGYDMYLKLLADAVNEETTGVPVAEEKTCTVDLNISAHIPEAYIESLSARIGIYKRIAAIKNEDNASDVIDELCDRFGEPPKSVLGLIDISLLRSKATAAEIYEITSAGSNVVLHINSINPEIAGKLSEYFKNRFVLSVTGTPVYTIRLEKGQKITDLVSELTKAL